tara:strand:- start:113 stop:901 length:789 start_codon:yes stop_codon:yes gene_type:complete
VKLPREALLKGCKDPAGMERLIQQAEQVFRTWQPIWSDFISAPLREEAIKRMAPLNNFLWHSDGGYPKAERHRLLCIRGEEGIQTPKHSAPTQAIKIEGNFLFDRASLNDFRTSLHMMGASCGGIGDIWIRGDRGAQAICTPEAAEILNGQKGNVRDVQIRCESIKTEELRIPIERSSRRITTVEASTRLDAIASAGLGLSRTKIVTQIKQGRVRVNWEPIKQASKELNAGDRIQMEGKGCLEVLSLDLTKRQRWRVELLRH